jgi:hypothetical protein
MNAEQMGRRVNPNNSGRAGVGQLYEFAKRQREVYEAQRQTREKELTQLEARRAELLAHQRRISTEASARREQEHAATRNYRNELQSQLDAARTELRGHESSRLAKIEEFRRKEIGGSEFQKQKDDPLARMRAYQELKSDPRDGATIVWFSWMTKLLVIFLEVVPVVAKMFFSPPSAYAARIQAQVEREMVRARQENEARFTRDVPVVHEIDALRNRERELAPGELTARKGRSRPAPEEAVS